MLIETQCLAAEILYQHYPAAKMIADNAPQVYLVQNVFVSNGKSRYGLSVWAVKISDSRYGGVLIRSGRRIDGGRISSGVFVSFSEAQIIKKFEDSDFIDPFTRLEHTIMGLPRITVLVRTRNAAEARDALNKAFNDLDADIYDVCLVMRFFKKGKRYYWAVIKNDLAYGVNINGKEALTFPAKQVLKTYSVGERINQDYRLISKRGILSLMHVVLKK